MGISAGDGSTRIERGAVVAQADELISQANKIKGDLDNLNTAVSSLRGKWSGAAQEAYDLAQKKWVQKVDEMNTLLGQIGYKTQDLSAQYGHQDGKSALRFSHGD